MVIVHFVVTYFCLLYHTAIGLIKGSRNVTIEKHYVYFKSKNATAQIIWTKDGKIVSFLSISD